MLHTRKQPRVTGDIFCGKFYTSTEETTTMAWSETPYPSLLHRKRATTNAEATRRLCQVVGVDEAETTFEDARQRRKMTYLHVLTTFMVADINETWNSNGVRFRLA